uniref:Uncharacterized protein n=1 Tax=Arundo donax TaxID=35708 RepID=A0A0A8YD04_ARUDO
MRAEGPACGGAQGWTPTAAALQHKTPMQRRR